MHHKAWNINFEWSNSHLDKTSLISLSQDMKCWNLATWIKMVDCTITCDVVLFAAQFFPLFFNFCFSEKPFHLVTKFSEYVSRFYISAVEQAMKMGSWVNRIDFATSKIHFLVIPDLSYTYINKCQRQSGFIVFITIQILFFVQFCFFFFFFCLLLHKCVHFCIMNQSAWWGY